MKKMIPSESCVFKKYENETYDGTKYEVDFPTYPVSIAPVYENTQEYSSISELQHSIRTIIADAQESINKANNRILDSINGLDGIIRGKIFDLEDIIERNIANIISACHSVDAEENIYSIELTAGLRTILVGFASSEEVAREIGELVSRRYGVKYDRKYEVIISNLQGQEVGEKR